MSDLSEYKVLIGQYLCGCDLVPGLKVTGDDVPGVAGADAVVDDDTLDKGDGGAFKLFLVLPRPMEILQIENCQSINVNVKKF